MGETPFPPARELDLSNVCLGDVGLVSQGVHALAGPSQTDSNAEATLSGNASYEDFHPERCGNRGLPVEVEWERQRQPITDGFGLCSPTRWRPHDRGARLGEVAVKLSRVCVR